MAALYQPPAPFLPPELPEGIPDIYSSLRPSSAPTPPRPLLFVAAASLSSSSLCSVFPCPSLLCSTSIDHEGSTSARPVGKFRFFRLDEKFWRDLMAGKPNLRRLSSADVYFVAADASHGASPPLPPPHTTSRCRLNLLESRIRSAPVEDCAWSEPTLQEPRDGDLSASMRARAVAGGAGLIGASCRSCRLQRSACANPAKPVILDYLAIKTISMDLVVVSPDVGCVVRARAFAKKLSDAPLAIVDKRRQGHNLLEIKLTRESPPWRRVDLS